MVEYKQWGWILNNMDEYKQCVWIINNVVEKWAGMRLQIHLTKFPNHILSFALPKSYCSVSDCICRGQNINQLNMLPKNNGSRANFKLNHFHSNLYIKV